MTAKKTNYWAVITFDQGIVFEGTHSECWDHMISKFYNLTLGQCELAGIKITRIR